MVKIWQFWEFEHSSNSIIRVIDVPSGLELFASDVFQVIAPELNEKVILLGIKYRQRHVLVNQRYILVNTLNALAIHGLIGVVEADIIRKFMHWVRSNIIPVFRNTHLLESHTKYLSRPINYHEKILFKKYLSLRIQCEWVEDVINFYLDFIYHKNPSPAVCIQDINKECLCLREQYLGLVGNIFYQQIDSYQNLYERLVLESPDLLIAQEFDLYVFNYLKQKQDDNLLDSLKQGLVIQALNSIPTNLKTYEYLKDLEKLYLQILEYFSEDMMSSEE